MKKLLYILLMSLAAGACDILDQAPSEQLPTGSAIQTIDDLQNAVNGVYYIASYGDNGTLGSELAIYADLKGGDVKQIGTSSQIASRIANSAITPAESYPFYYYLYCAIANVNKALEQGAKLEGAETHLAELYALRGWLHFELARVFAPIPTAENPDNKMGIVYADEVYETTHIAARNSLEETYAKIVADLTKAIDMGKDDAAYQKKNTGHMNYWAALGMRARAYLYWGKNAEALADCKEIIANSGLSLYAIADYTSVWGRSGSTEMLMEILQTDDYNAQRYAPGYYTSPEGYAECAMTDDFFAFLTADAKDVRAKMVEQQNDSKGANTGYYPLKYPGNAGCAKPLYTNNIKVMRLSEIYLIAAEAALKAGTDTPASYINDLRRKRIEGYADVASVTLDDILNERRKELFAENHAAFDQWRNQRDVVKSATSKISCTDFRTVTPIPIDEILLSDKLLVQNPGWGN